MPEIIEQLKREPLMIYTIIGCKGPIVSFRTRPSLLKVETENWRRAHESGHKNNGTPICDQFRVETKIWKDVHYPEFPLSISNK